MFFLYDLFLLTGDEINVGKFGAFTVFRINRPEKRNCLNYSCAVKLKEALNSFNNDRLSSVGIIMGEGGNFCSGLDLNELAKDRKFYQNFWELVRELKLLGFSNFYFLIHNFHYCFIGFCLFI